MALTQYTADTDIIEKLGTNPEDRPTLTDNSFKAKFDENSENIKVFLNAMIAELLSTAAGKGASQIGIEDSAGRYTATQIEAALAEIAGSGRTTETVKGLADLISNLAGTGRTTETVKAAADAIASHTATISWTAPTLLNSWVNFGAGFSSAGYMKDAHGFVHIKGLVKSGTTTSGTTIFVLPAGYRPLELEAFMVYSNDGAVVGAINIINAGNVIIISGGNASFSLSGITFKAA